MLTELVKISTQPTSAECSKMIVNVLDTSFLLLINVLYSEDVLWRVRTKY